MQSKQARAFKQVSKQTSKTPFHFRLVRITVHAGKMITYRMSRASEKASECKHVSKQLSKLPFISRLLWITVHGWEMRKYETCEKRVLKLCWRGKNLAVMFSWDSMDPGFLFCGLLELNLSHEANVFQRCYKARVLEAEAEAVGFGSRFQIGG